MDLERWWQLQGGARFCRTFVENVAKAALEELRVRTALRRWNEERAAVLRGAKVSMIPIPAPDPDRFMNAVKRGLKRET